MDSEIEERARGGFHSGLGFVLGIAAAAMPIAAAVSAVSAGAAASTGLVVAVAVLTAAVAAIIALVGRFGVSPVWPILGFVITIVLLFLVGYAAWNSEPPNQPDCIPMEECSL